ncbi:LysR family transcriptional regulator [Pseudoxanthomonas sp. JBR18]|uniref:LysR family transcriptional regulator n=1 Tax=Pseudoxanthomonas sp. JBR18 TaxID=2969308 RepID=UPI002306DC81|nr:LysR family transcriptional regulator [Pseudoxanthomonas sp. JBR18]WCE06286.1 LysR family transcriptional regulator [Pseudoxanthomonas sp. JBR18]
MAFDERVLNGMGVLSAIVDCGSFAAAAEALDMSQPGVSRAVARLEARLGVRLFDRTTRSVSLTDEGHRLYERALPLLAALEEAASDVSAGATAVRGRLRVSVDPYFSRLMLGPQLGGFLAAHPQLQLELINRDRLGDIVADGFDMAVRFHEPVASSLVARRLLDTRILTVAAPAYLRRHGTPRAPKELESDAHICIQYRDPLTGRPFDWEFHRGKRVTKVSTHGQLTVNDVGTQHSVCLAGHGIAQVMALGVEPLLRSGKLVQVLPEWSDERFSLYALYPSRHHLPAKCRAFLDFVAGVVVNMKTELALSP